MEEEKKVFKLEAENELHVIVNNKPHDVGVELLDGFAEILGTEMEKNKVYSFPQFSFIPVFTWHGCSIKVIGTPNESYIATYTHMNLYSNLHARLEKKRINAEKTNSKGPVILIAGSNNHGKNCLVRILLNYAARMGRRPFLIDIDVGQNSLSSLPGTINVLKVEKPADIVNGFDKNSVSVYPYGYTNPSEHIVLYFLLLQKINRALQNHMDSKNPKTCSSGLVINSCSWTSGHGYSALILAAMTFEIDKLVVLGDTRLYVELKRDLPTCVDVIYFPQMAGIVTYLKEIRTHLRDKRIREYFYGSTYSLRPFTFDILFSDVQIFWIGMKHEVQDVAGASLSDISLFPVPLSLRLLTKVLAISSAEEVSREIVLSNVIGFVCVLGLDPPRNTLKILCPQPGPLPKKILLMGSIILFTKLLKKEMPELFSDEDDEIVKQEMPELCSDGDVRIVKQEMSELCSDGDFRIVI